MPLLQDNNSSPRVFLASDERGLGGEAEEVSLKDVYLGHGRAHALWQEECKKQLKIFQVAEICTSDRKFREALHELVTIVADIVRNCEKDPADIHEEIGLPGILKRLSAAVNELVPVLAQPNLTDEIINRKNLTEKNILDSTVSLKEILKLMVNNDALDIESRTRLVNRILSVKPK